MLHLSFAVCACFGLAVWAALIVEEGRHRGVGSDDDIATLAPGTAEGLAARTTTDSEECGVAGSTIT